MVVNLKQLVRKMLMLFGKCVKHPACFSHKNYPHENKIFKYFRLGCVLLRTNYSVNFVCFNLITPSNNSFVRRVTHQFNSVQSSLFCVILSSQCLCILIDPVAQPPFWSQSRKRTQRRENASNLLINSTRAPRLAQHAPSSTNLSLIAFRI